MNKGQLKSFFDSVFPPSDLQDLAVEKLWEWTGGHVGIRDGFVEIGFTCGERTVCVRISKDLNIFKADTGPNGNFEVELALNVFKNVVV